MKPDYITYPQWLDGRQDSPALWSEYCAIYYGEWLPF